MIGLMLGKGSTWSGLWDDARSLWARKTPGVHPNDAVWKATLPKPDPLAGLPEGPLNELLKPELTPEQQTEIVGRMLIDYWTSVRSLPSGSWDEIREQLAGRNRQELNLVPKEHPALATGAFRRSAEEPGIHLHVVSSSGCAFQLIHEGPDKQPYTDDDWIRNFPPDLKF